MKSDQIQQDIDTILNSKKYKSLGIPRDTLEDLFKAVEPKVKSHKDLVKQVRQKLHNIIAPYLGDPDYERTAHILEDVFQKFADEQSIKSTCLDILTMHASTRERIPCLDAFYSTIFDITGEPHSVLDLACGLNPFAYRWMGLEKGIRYHAYDLHQPRIRLINHYFELEGLRPLAERRDILVKPPDIDADVAFFLKEAHRFEQRQHGCNRAFWQALHVGTLVVSLPAVSLDGQRSLVERHQRLVTQTIAGLSWHSQDITLANELVFIIKK